MVMTKKNCRSYLRPGRRFGRLAETSATVATFSSRKRRWVHVGNRGIARSSGPYPVRRRAVQINLEGRVWERTVEDQFDVPSHYASIMSMSTWKSFLVNCYRTCVPGHATAIS